MAIVRAAAQLWRERGLDKVTVQDIASTAGVAPQTLYNLIGGQHQIVFAVLGDLLNRLKAALAATAARSGIDQVLACASLSVEMFVADAALYRQLIARIPVAVFSGAQFLGDAPAILAAAVARAQGEGAIDPAQRPEVLGLQIYLGYLGALFSWACEISSDAAFAAQARLAALTVLAAAATPATRDALVREIAETSRLMTRQPA